MKTHEITEADVVAFLQAKQAELRKATGVQYSSIAIETDPASPEIKWRSYSDQGKHIYAQTAGESIASQSSLVSPAARAANARERAAQLLAEAAQLEAAK